MTTYLKGEESCDVSNCKYGTAIGTAMSTTVSAVGTATCASTFGAGCIMALISSIAGAGTTASK